MTTGILLNTRPAFYRERFHRAFADMGWPILDCPVLAPEPTHAPLPPSADFDAVVFTSQVAVAMLEDRDAWREKTAYAVGPGTADAAREAGFARTVQTGFDAADLVRHLAAAGFRRALYPSAAEVSADIALADARVTRVPVYRMTPRGDLPADLLAAVRAGRPVLVPLFSKRSAAALADLLRRAGVTPGNARVVAVAISAEALGPDAGPWQGRGVADKPTLESVATRTRDMAVALTSEASS